MTSTDASAELSSSTSSRGSRPFSDAPRLKVGLSDSAVATEGDVLLTSGLGSCVAVALYDPSVGIGGLLHAMLPDAQDSPGVEQKFVVQGVDALVEALAEAGAAPSGLRAKIAGAAEMLELGNDDGDSIGDRNVAAAERVLDEHAIPVAASDTGGSRGRSIRFDTAEGRLQIVYAGGDSVIL